MGKQQINKNFFPISDWERSLLFDVQLWPMCVFDFINHNAIFWLHSKLLFYYLHYQQSDYKILAVVKTNDTNTPTYKINIYASNGTLLQQWVRRNSLRVGNTWRTKIIGESPSTKMELFGVPIGPITESLVNFEFTK